MKGWSAGILISALIAFCGCSKSAVTSPGSFTRDYAEAFRKAAPGIKIVIVRDLELKLTYSDGRDLTNYLDNAYDVYKQDPKAETDVIQRFIASGLENMGPPPVGVDRTRIVPVIKDRPWLEETRQALLNRGVKEFIQPVYEDFSPDLIILYAEDSPKNIRYLRPKDLESGKIEKSELRALACENLKRLLPKIERQGANGLYMITAGGNYEASLLLLDSIWNGGQVEVKGDIVVAIPSRDLLLVTGSQDRPGIAKLKQAVKEASTNAAYRLTEKLFVYRDEKFIEFTADEDMPFQ